jgi:SAM-dependent methyltransferase
VAPSALQTARSVLLRAARNRHAAKHLLVDYLVERELHRIAPKAGGLLLDIGCGVKPYAPIFAPYVEAHLGVDHSDSPHGTASADIIASAYEIPVDDGVVDTVLCTAVLEHLEEPEAALREARRTLRGGGLALYTAPLIWHLHEEPRDFFRYTEYGLRHLFESAGFEVVEITPLSGFWVTAGQLVVYYLHRFNRGPMQIIPVIPLAGVAIQGVVLGLNRFDRATSWTWAYSVVARAA